MMRAAQRAGGDSALNAWSRRGSRASLLVVLVRRRSLFEVMNLKSPFLRFFLVLLQELYSARGVVDRESRSDWIASRDEGDETR
jgi:hypothetical protein